MNSKFEPSKTTASSGDTLKYISAGTLVVAGLLVWFLATSWFAQWGNWGGQLRGLAVIAGLVAGGFVFMSTAKGDQVREFLVESRFELRKVVWPTRQESVRMTWVVVAVVIVLSLLLGGFDFFIQKLIQWFLGR